MTHPLISGTAIVKRHTSTIEGGGPYWYECDNGNTRVFIDEYETPATVYVNCWRCEPEGKHMAALKLTHTNLQRALGMMVQHHLERHS